jgi:hypothetical protein
VSGERLERVQLVISMDQSEWLNELASEIKQRTGAHVTRSEITRAAISALREMHRLGIAGCFDSLADCTSCSELTVAGVVTVRQAAQQQ